MQELARVAIFAMFLPTGLGMGPVQADDLRDALKSCVLIKSDAERLKCFDSINAPRQAVNPETKWSIETAESKLDKSKTVVAALPSKESRVFQKMGGTENDTLLVIRCIEGKTELFLSFGYFVAPFGSGGVEVQYRVGKNPPKKEKWGSSQNGNAFGPWANKNTVPLIKQSMEEEDFFVRSDARIVGSTESLFDLQGIKDAVKQVRDACKW